MKRSVVLAATWLLSAGLAVGLGFLAVSFVNTSPSSASLRTAAVTSDDRSVDGTSSPGGTTAPAGTSARQVTAGGTVLATCAGSSAQVAGAPATGWRIDDSSGAGTVEFRSSSQSVEVRVDCSSGSPVFAVEGPRSSGGGSDDGTTGSSTVTRTTGATPTTDDHGSGGHGADG
jgi:hypothetical protein